MVFSIEFISSSYKIVHIYKIIKNHQHDIEWHTHKKTNKNRNTIRIYKNLEREREKREARKSEWKEMRYNNKCLGKNVWRQKILAGFAYKWLMSLIPSPPSPPRAHTKIDHQPAVAHDLRRKHICANGITTLWLFQYDFGCIRKQHRTNNDKNDKFFNTLACKNKTKKQRENEVKRRERKRRRDECCNNKIVY